ncbi:MAG: DUF1805 domain-containing protein [Candidatus Omnitrophica bacterium]|nr:DUF1805 domain-containing protein [Candidatus Omnitrophota bacterium]
MRYKKIKIGSRAIEAVEMKLLSKALILLRGTRGYVMCGYLNLRAAEKCKDAAVKITGVSNIEEALKAQVHSCTSAARRLGVKKGQPVKAVLRLIA